MIYLKELLMGAIIGGFAHFGLRIDSTETVTMQSVLAYLLQLGFIILVAATVVYFGEITEPIIIIAIAAISALAGRDLVAYVKDKWSVIMDALTKK